MEHIIIGTAGHIDHGKTRLIEALTGRNTDTIKEEKQRGITIDLGFTYFDLSCGMRAGIIDVPGHEKFLPNMLAGVCGMDMVLLVIALDEGVKPQTLEHMEILSQLDIRQGIIVLTKLDSVEADWADLIEEEVVETMQGTLFADWPRIRVSSIRGDGMEELKKQILKLASEAKQDRRSAGTFRMPIDRVLSLEGRGTVIAGTILEGRVQSGDEIELYPEGQRARIRSIQAHGETIESAVAGQRAALLIAGVKRQEVTRGHIAAVPGTLTDSERLDVKLRLSKDTIRILKNRARVHLHIGTNRMLCRVILFGMDELSAGKAAYAQLVLEEKAVVRKGDHFVIRFYSPLETIGGGFVLDECAKKHKRSDDNVRIRLKQLEENNEEQILLDLICNSKDRLVSQEELSENLGMSLQSLMKIFNSARGNSEICNHDKGKEVFFEMKGIEIRILKGKKTDFFASQYHLDKWYQQIIKWFEQGLQSHPYCCKQTKQTLKREVFQKWENDRFETFLNYLIQNDLLYKENELYMCPTVTIIKDTRFYEIQKMLNVQLTQARFQLVDYRDLCPEEMSEDMFKDILTVLIEEKELVQISKEFYITAELKTELIERVKVWFQENAVITYTALRDMLETTRRSVKPLVTYLDEQKITMPCGKETERKKA